MRIVRCSGRVLGGGGGGFAGGVCPGGYLPGGGVSAREGVCPGGGGVCLGVVSADGNE